MAVLIFFLLLLGATAETSLVFGQGTVPVGASNFGCSGSEDSYTSCPHSTSGFCCGHHQDVGVRCSPQCTNGDVRLVNGMNLLEGRIEICVNRDWNTVCDDSFSIEDATVICRQLGHSTLSEENTVCAC